MMPDLKDPFPYFGGKRAIADQVWSAFGDVKNYVEPFCGSAAVLLQRPAPIVGSETLNDYSCSLINAWRAIARKPEELTEWLVGPVSEVETEAQHWAIIQREFDLRPLLGDTDYCDVRFAAFWIRGANEWIGSGWGNADGPWSWSRSSGWQKRSRKLPHLGDAGTGINRQLPHLGDAGKGEYEKRCDFVFAWLSALRDRLCGVRICCGSWERVLTPSVCGKHGTTAVFLDPPYDETEYVYGDATHRVSSEVRAWCVEHGGDEHFRIVLAGRADEHDALLETGWTKRGWTANRGYSSAGNEGRKQENLWFSPACLLPSPTDLI
jgi:site-specific DNA-adenine methylase